MIAKAMAKSKAEIGDNFFKQVCYDVLSPRIGKGKNNELDAKIVIDDLLKSEGLDKPVIKIVKKKGKEMKGRRKVRKW